MYLGEPCEVVVCDRPAVTRRLCRAHYLWWQRNGVVPTHAVGSPPPRERVSLRDRILASIEVDETECWIWQPSRNSSGYGQLQHDGKNLAAHRVAYEQFVGLIPDGLELDHLCRVRACCNPIHLEPVTHQENMRRGRFGAATHCPHGHPYSEDNTYRTREGHRHCRTCTLTQQREKKRAAS